MSFERLFYGIIILAWIAGVILYLFYFQRNLAKKRAEEKERKGKRKLGKRCPQCRNIIDYRRPVCQHCGYQFPEVPKHSYDQPKRKKRRGKKCPQCGNTINYYREVCQHCGYKFGGVKQEPEAEKVLDQTPESQK